MKAVLVIDMPKTCDECKLNQLYNDCNISCDRPYREGKKPDCPLKPMPQKTGQSKFCKTMQEAVNLGWDICIETITGETE